MTAVRVRVLRDLLKHGIKTRVDCSASPPDEIEAILAMGSDGWISIAPYPPGGDRYQFIEILAFSEGAYQALKMAGLMARLGSWMRSPVFWSAVVAIATVGILIVAILELGARARTPSRVSESPLSRSLSQPRQSPSSSPTEGPENGATPANP